MRLPKIPKHLDPRFRFRKRKTDPDAPKSEPKSYSQAAPTDDLTEFERLTGEVVREGANEAPAPAGLTADPANQRTVHEMEQFEDLTDEPVRER